MNINSLSSLDPSIYLYKIKYHLTITTWKDESLVPGQHREMHWYHMRPVHSKPYLLNTSCVPGTMQGAEDPKSTWKGHCPRGTHSYYKQILRWRVSSVKIYSPKRKEKWQQAHTITLYSMKLGIFRSDKCLIFSLFLLRVFNMSYKEA